MKAPFAFYTLLPGDGLGNYVGLGWGLEVRQLGLPGGAVVKNPPANAGYMGLSPGPGRSHMPWSS